MTVTIKSLAAEDRVAMADVKKDLAFLQAAGEGDGLAVLALMRKTFDGGEEARLLAGIEALERIFRAGA